MSRQTLPKLTNQDAEHVLRLIAAHPDFVEPDDAVQAHAELVGMARTYLADRDS